MHFLLTITIHTLNILGIFNDPFEFEGDYGPEVNETRQKVFELVLQKEDTPYGPILSELITPRLIDEIKHKQHTLPSDFSEEDLNAILTFIDDYQNSKLFSSFRQNPSELLKLDKLLRTKAAREGKSFDLPILGSPKILEGANSFELKKNLLDAVFTKEALNMLKPLKFPHDLQAFSSPAGQAFYFWIYHALHLHLVADKPGLLQEVNMVKKQFGQNIGNQEARAKSWKAKLHGADTGLLFTQESDSLVPQYLTQDGLFLPVDKQNPADGTFIFLRSDLWEADYENIDINNYDGFTKGRMNLILARNKETGLHFLLASCHGNSTNAADGRLQISLIMNKFFQLSHSYDDLQLVIGIDANTKTEEDVFQFRKHLDDLGLIATKVGPTTIKKRMLTAQHAKSGKCAIDEEDYLITLKVENGGRYLLNHQTVGFKEEPANISNPLPNIDNPSDHYPVGAQLEKLEIEQLI